MSLPGIRQKPRVGAFVCLRPQGRAGDFGCVQYGYTASRARCVWLLCGYVVGGASYAFGEVQQCPAQLLRLGGGEAPGASVAVDSV